MLGFIEGRGTKINFQDHSMKKIENRKTPEYSVVVPVYNSEPSLGELCHRISDVFTKLGETYEIVLVDDSSSDNSWEVLNGLRKENKVVKIIQLMKNFGQHNATMCGFQHSSGKYVITMDDDLQNPPEEIPKLIDAIEKGYDAVIGALESKKDTFLKKAGSSFVRYLNSKIFKTPKNMMLSSFRIMTKSVAHEIGALKTPYPYISGMLFSVTHNITNVIVAHERRKYGKSNYTFTRLVKLAFNLIINYTSLPLRFLSGVGLVFCILSFFMGLFFIVKKLLVKQILPGWTTVVVLLSFFNGLLLIILSIMGEYLGRIIGEVSNKHQFIVREKHV
jgi:glycosyltransferase involved in cell wall biosynthesis